VSVGGFFDCVGVVVVANWIVVIADCVSVVVVVGYCVVVFGRREGGGVFRGGKYGGGIYTVVYVVLVEGGIFLGYGFSVVFFGGGVFFDEIGIVLNVVVIIIILNIVVEIWISIFDNIVIVIIIIIIVVVIVIIIIIIVIIIIIFSIKKRISFH